MNWKSLNQNQARNKEQSASHSPGHRQQVVQAGCWRQKVAELVKVGLCKEMEGRVSGRQWGIRGGDIAHHFSFNGKSGIDMVIQRFEKEDENGNNDEDEETLELDLQQEEKNEQEQEQEEQEEQAREKKMTKSLPLRQTPCVDNTIKTPLLRGVWGGCCSSPSSIEARLFTSCKPPNCKHDIKDETKSVRERQAITAQS